MATDVDNALLTGLAAGPTPPTDDELAVYLNRLLSEQKLPAGASDWRRLSPPGAGQAGLVNNGDFERPARATPFDWVLGNGVGWTAQVVQAPGNGHGKALNVDYDNVSPPQQLQQYLVLAPGQYRLSGMVFDQSGQGADSLSWRLSCAGARQALAGARDRRRPGRMARLQRGTDRAGRPVARRRRLALTADPGDVHKDIEVWYDNLAITPIAAQWRTCPIRQAPQRRLAKRLNPASRRLASAVRFI